MPEMASVGGGTGVDVGVGLGASVGVGDGAAVIVGDGVGCACRRRRRCRAGRRCNLHHGRYHSISVENINFAIAVEVKGPCRCCYQIRQ